MNESKKVKSAKSGSQLANKKILLNHARTTYEIFTSIRKRDTPRSRRSI